MEGVCALSKKKCELRMSHIYPKFTIKYLKQTSTGFLRRYSNMNAGMQDGLKEFLLSDESEKLFSKSETWFANNLFHPLIKNEKQVFSYDNNLFYFALSVLWRALLLQLRDKAIQKEWYYGRLIDCEIEWRKFLLNGELPCYFRNIFMMAIHYNSLQIPTLKGTQFYILRDLDSTIVTSSHTAVYVYAKLPRFIFWAPINSPYFSEANFIDVIGGTFDTRAIPNEPAIFSFLPHRIAEVNQLKKHISPAQEKIILARIMKDEKKFFSSEAGQLLITEA